MILGNIVTGKPNKKVKVYRAVPKGVTEINSGDWVTLSKEYAKMHGEHPLDGNYDIIETEVEANKLFNEAVKTNGANSLEAREALHNLKEAQNRLKDATDKANVAQENQNLANGLLRLDTPATVNAIQLRIDKFSGLAGTLSSANGQLAVLDANIQSKAPVLQGSVQRLQGSIQNLQGSIQNLQGTKINLQGGTIQLQGARAGGGPVQAGKSYLVGEEGMEIFTPDTSGRIIPNDKIKSGTTSASTAITQPIQQTTINFDPQIQIGMFAGMPTEYREMAERLWVEFQRIAQSNGIKLQTIGARSQ